MRFRPLTLLCAATCMSLAPCLSAATYHIGVHFREAIDIDENEDSSLVNLNRVTFDPETLDWTSLDDEFEEDDVFEITLDEVGTISIRIESVVQGEDYIALTGIFEEGVGWAQILFISNRLCVMLSDYQDNTIFHIVFSEIEQCYTVRIVEPDAAND